ncbi:DUF3800 domain-containing protein [Agrobacterium tumefaciens]|nr:DUF3800 domain-containing protein [Agrobacterium tumefaciens]
MLYFCDESSQDGDTYMAVAGIAVAREAIPIIVGQIMEIRERFGKRGEVKWKNAKSRSGVVHEAYIKLLFALVNEGRLHFHVRFSRMDEYDHKRSGARKKIDTVSKAFFQLLLHRPVAFYGSEADIFIHPDDGDCTSELVNQMGALNFVGRRMCNASGIVKLVQPRSSEREPMLQLLDCTLGALAAYRNGRHEKAQISDVKKKLAVMAFEMTGWPDITGNCWKDKRKLNRWNAVPRFKKG